MEHLWYHYLQCKIYGGRLWLISLFKYSHIEVVVGFDYSEPHLHIQFSSVDPCVPFDIQRTGFVCHRIFSCVVSRYRE
jgi:hypothetical protein